MDSRVQVYRLGIAPLFHGLSDQEKRYGHYMARAAWSGTRIILRQVSPEAEPIFDFLIELHKSCNGDWSALVAETGLSGEDVLKMKEYAATFFSNVGYYYGSGDQKFTPGINIGKLEKLASRSPELTRLFGKCIPGISLTPPFGLGYPSDVAQSSYYLGQRISKSEIAAVSKVLNSNSIFLENTGIRKTGDTTFEVIQASVAAKGPDTPLVTNSQLEVKLVRGNHAADLAKVCENLKNAAKYAANDIQRKFLAQYIESFQTGSLDVYRDSQRTWVSDKAPKIENIFGFVEPYRDPAGIRAEFEGLVAIADAEETKLLANLVRESDRFVRRLPWASPENNGKGVFEKSLFEPPDFSSIHALAYCSSIIFPGINLPNYNDIRQDVGFKNVIIANRMVAESTAVQWPFIPENEMEVFQKHKYLAYYWWVVLHELLGHGTGKMMMEEQPGKFNFDLANPPTSPLDGKPITSCYRAGETWTGLFGDLATTMDECRAELVGAYLMDDTELLALFGYTEETDIKARDLTYNLYQQLGVDGLRGLANVSEDGTKWGQAHSQAHYAMMRCLLRDGGGCLKIKHDVQAQTLKVHVDRFKILSHGKKALGSMLLRLHMYRCTADVEPCRTYYEELSHVDEEALRWRKTVMANKPPPMLNVQANTFIEDGEVFLKEYKSSVDGIIQSWVERRV
ncbi:peptidase [Xylariaceae sp. AK1471]|nr:peptidase [Xylariaceae sp. AK1471]